MRRRKRLQSWYRPWLDGIDEWPVPELRPENVREMEDILQPAADQAVACLDRMFGPVSRGFGADAVARSMGARNTDGGAFALARAATALDYYFHYAGPPRPQPGGLANLRNRRVWERLEPHIRARQLTLLERGAAESIVWRTIFDRIPRHWVERSAIERLLERRIAGSGAFASVRVEADLRPAVPGGDDWTADRTEQALVGIEAALAVCRPLLVELFRGTVRSPAAADVVVVCAMLREGSDAALLACHDPRKVDGRLDLIVSRRDGRLCFAEPGSADDLPAVKALRIWPFEPVPPPLFGLRRRLDAVLPWRMLWRIARAAALAAARIRGRK